MNSDLCDRQKRKADSFASAPVARRPPQANDEAQDYNFTLNLRFWPIRSLELCDGNRAAGTNGSG